uniref:hypothetical protein n=1 Tax=Jatropha curcas TaxID=180498 RepID=UPI00279A49B9|nr:hypothetical protein QLP06_mgp087 [Jatropha curcas]WFG81152.1 hypothetical protein [Jatropha curcas]
MPFATFARIRNSSIYANGSVVILYSILPSSQSFPFELMRANWQEARTFSANREQSSESLIGIRDLVNKHSHPRNSYLLLRSEHLSKPSSLPTLSVNAFLFFNQFLFFLPPPSGNYRKPLTSFAPFYIYKS